MKIEDIITGLNKSLETERTLRALDVKGHFVLQKTIEPHETFKAYKKFTFTVWYVQNRKKYRIKTVQKVDKIIDGHEDKIVDSISIELITRLFQFVQGIFYKKIIEGEAYETT